MTTMREGKLRRTSIALFVALLVMAPLASFAGWGVRIGVGVPGPVFYGGYGVAPGPGYVWVPGWYDWRPAVGYAWVPGRWALPPFAGAVWFGPRWGFHGGHRVFVGGFWGHPGFHHRW